MRGRTGVSGVFRSGKGPLYLYVIILLEKSNRNRTQRDVQNFLKRFIKGLYGVLCATCSDL